MILIDTGYFIALFDRGDSLHPCATRWAAKVRERCLITEYVLVEVVNHFSRVALRSRAYDIADFVLAGRNHEFIAADAQLLKAGLDLHRRMSDKEWSLTDCISFHVMRERGITRALAYDHHFARRDSSRCFAVIPHKRD